MKATQLIGWYGVLAIVVAYALLNFSIIDSKSLVYLFLNITGSIGIIIEAKSKKDHQPLVLNIFWLLIAIIALMRR